MKFKANLSAPLLFGVILLITGLAPALSRLLVRLSEEEFLSTTLIQLLVFLLPLAFYYRVRGSAFSGAIRFQPPSLKKLPFLFTLSGLLFLGIVLLRYFGIFYLDGVYTVTAGPLPVMQNQDSTFLVLLSGVILPAVLEEVIFRGVLLREYAAFGTTWSVVASSLLYAMLHLSPARLPFDFFVGALLALAAVSSGSLLPSLILHLLLNLSHLYFTPAVTDYLRQAGKSPLLAYILVALFLLLLYFAFTHLEHLYRLQAYDEILESRKELLRRELEDSRDRREDESERGEKRKKRLFYSIQNVFLNPAFFGVVVIYVALVSGIF